MIVCNSCGREHKDSERQSFCVCGAYLEFEGKQVPDRVDAPEATSAGTSRAMPAPAVETKPAQTQPEPSKPPPVEGPIAGPTSRGAHAGVRRQAQESTPLPSNTPSTQAAGTAGTVPSTQWGPPRGLHPGDLVCPNCRDGNENGRRFCHRCGASLAGAKAIGAPAGPRLNVRWLIPGGVAALVLVLLLVAVAGAIYLRPILLPTYTPARPAHASASAQTQGHSAAMAIDGYQGTYWAAPVGGGGTPVLTVDFATSTTIGAVIFTAGSASGDPTVGRPRQVNIQFADGTSYKLTLRDDPGPQTFYVNGTGSAVRIEIGSSYGPAPGAVAIAEVEFFVKS